ncbi:DUF6603 domain-containing protein [Mongoliibacter ruber]|uniref:DUF6603 domain-containing protein n=1 Tax=Mongoliibacter ruber TaxID=1750599 RepID=A0A2T0WW78_9BACT|nr:DUF6603 domain-containing protein [Mongoliibacter ruber]PRY90939.1 hypothetical protein CLW00_101615 [Mongoliibacter ruber]
MPSNNFKFPIEDLLSSSGVQQLLDKIENNASSAQETYHLVIDKFQQANDNLPFEIPVEISEIQEAGEEKIRIVIQQGQEGLEFKMAEILAAIEDIEIKIRKAQNQVEDFLISAEAFLHNLKSELEEEAKKIPFRIEKTAEGEFNIVQTNPISESIVGISFTLQNASLTFSTSSVSAFNVEVIAEIPQLDQTIQATLNKSADTYTISSTSLPTAKLMAFDVEVKVFNLIIQNGSPMAGTAFSGDLSFPFLTSEADTLEWAVEFNIDESILFKANNQEDKPFHTGPIRFLFEKFEILIPKSAVESHNLLDCQAWMEIDGLTAGPANRTAVSLTYNGSIYTFQQLGAPSPIPSPIGELTIQQVYLEIQANGTIDRTDVNGNLMLRGNTGGNGIFWEFNQLGENYDLVIPDDSEQTSNQQFDELFLTVLEFKMEIRDGVLTGIGGIGKMVVPGMNTELDIGFLYQNTANPKYLSIGLQGNVGQNDFFDFQISLDKLFIRIYEDRPFDGEIKGMLWLPVFDQGNGVEFEGEIEENDFSISITSGGEWQFGDFELQPTSMSLVVASQKIQNFSGTVQFKLPDTLQTSTLNVSYLIHSSGPDEGKYQIRAVGSNIPAIDNEGFKINFDQIEVEINEGPKPPNPEASVQIPNLNITGSIEIPAIEMQGVIRYNFILEDNGKTYKLQKSPEAAIISYGPFSLNVGSFLYEVKDGDFHQSNGTGTITLPGLENPFDFAFNVDDVGDNRTFTLAAANLNPQDFNGFQISFTQIRFFRDLGTADTEFSANGTLALPIFENALNFDLEVTAADNSDFKLKVDSGEADLLKLGGFELSDFKFDLQVTNEEVENSTGSAKLKWPELGDGNNTIAVIFDYEKTGAGKKIEFTLNNDLAQGQFDFSVFQLALDELSIEILNDDFEKGELKGKTTLPVFTGNEVNFHAEIDHSEKNYSVAINSTTEELFTFEPIVLKNINLSCNVDKGAGDAYVISAAGDAEFMILGAESDAFSSIEISYEGADEKFKFEYTGDQTVDFNFLKLKLQEVGFGLKKDKLEELKIKGGLVFEQLDEPNNELKIDFAFSDTQSAGTSYIIQLNNGTEDKTKLKLGELSLFFESFSLSILNGNVQSASGEVAFSHPAIKNIDQDSPAEISLGVSYESDDERYSFSLSTESEGDAGSFRIGDFSLKFEKLAFSIENREFSFPFEFEGELGLPGLVDNSENPKPILVKIEIEKEGKFVLSLKNPGDAGEINLGNIKIVIKELTVKNQATFEIELKGELSIEGLVGIEGNPPKIEVTIGVSDSGDFLVKAEASNAVKLLDIPSVVGIYLKMLQLKRKGEKWDFALGGIIKNHIVIPGLDTVIPSELDIKKLEVGSKFDLNMDVRWPSGLSVSIGSESPELRIPIDINGKLGEGVSIDAINLALSLKDGENSLMSMSFSGATVMLGPLSATVEGLGLEVEFHTKDPNQNHYEVKGIDFGVVDIEIRFMPPTGLGVSLDTPVFTGGGYLFFDKPKGQYAGALELSFKGMFTLTAIGVIDSKMPDGKPGTSVIVIISVQFSPGIALGFGFFLSGLGGILGIHRTMQENKLRDGVRDGSIDNILFPTNIIPNIAKIINDITGFFPIKRDQFLIGPMARISWGVPTLLRIDLGLIVEFANPVRFAILGAIRLNLPDEKIPLVRIQVLFLGIIDFEKKMLSFDASLFDSKILTFGLEGDMALRLSWGPQKDFVLSVGGFHPAYVVPAYLNIPSMKRLTINILTGNPRLTLSAYMAVTTNTVQFGAQIDFLFKVSKFKVVGELGIDALFQFSPFRFMASARARLAVMAGSTTLLSISLSFELEGPSPWKAKGTASFKILFITVKVKFNVEWGEKKNTTLPDIAVLPELRKALNEKQNWRAIPMAVKGGGVRLKDPHDADSLILTPNGVIEVNQKIVPLDVTIEKFGHFNPEDFDHFKLVKPRVGSGNTDANTSPLMDDFAPSNFINASDQDKLLMPSFEQQQSGIIISSKASTSAGQHRNKLVEYEEIVDEVHTGVKRRFEQSESKFHAMHGAVSQTLQSVRSKGIFNPAKVILEKPSFSVVNKGDLQATVSGVGYMQAVQLTKGKKQQLQILKKDLINI